MTIFAFSREPDDPTALRASIGGSELLGYYLVFRGEPDATLAMLREVLAEAERALPAGDYADKRGRPQG